MSETRIIENLRSMAWQRAKGELYSMLETYYPDENQDEAKNFSVLEECIRDFVSSVEGNELQN